MKKIIPILCFCATLVACKKDTENLPPAQTKENIAGLYKLTALTLKTGTTPETSVIDSYVPACQKDDLQQFKTDLTYNYIDAGTRCSPPSDDNGIWSLPTAGKMVIDGESFDIVSFSGTELVLSNQEVVLGTNTTFKTTLTKQ